MKRIISIILISTILLSAVSGCSKAEKPLSAVELLDLGEKYLLELNYEQAIVYFEKLIEIEPMNPRGYIGAAEAYFELGEIEKAVNIIEKGLIALPKNAEICEQAIVCFEKLIETDPINPRGYTGLAEAFVGLGDIERAIEVLRDGLEKLPNYADIIAMIDRLLGWDSQPENTNTAEPIIDETDETTTESTELVHDDHIIEWVDSEFERKIREELNKPSGDIWCSEVNNIGQLHFLEIEDNIGQSIPIASLDDIVHFSSLYGLMLDESLISDLSPLAKLTQLQYLIFSVTNTHIKGSGLISDLSPLSELSQLTQLDLRGNQVIDLTPLAGLTQLEYLELSDNQITDLTPLSELTQLKSLFLWGNHIKDISPLSGMTQIIGLS